MLTITFRRLKRDRRGISNIVVVALSLVIIIAIVSNIILWNYEMTQFDWEKMKEEATITNVEAVTDFSPWVTTQSEYVLSNGSIVNGNYVNTQSVDGAFESFSESSSGGSSSTILINAESFEYSWPPSGWTETDEWNKENNERYDGSYSADFDGGNHRSGTLTTFDMDCSGATTISVDFWYRDDGSESGEFVLQYFDGQNWDTVYDLGSTYQEHEWHHYQDEITDAKYFKSNFKIRWVTNTNHNSDDVYVDLVTVEKDSTSSSSVFDLTGQFTIDLSTYPLEYIQAVEMQLRYRASDSGERWYLKAYNWETSEYSDVGFNNTMGHLPTTDWDYYAINLEQWQSYVHSNGTIKIQFVDQQADSQQTQVDIDFLGVSVQMDGTNFTFENLGGLTVHLVSLWVNNETSHEHYNIDAFVNSAATKNYVLYGVVLPEEGYTIKAVTERGNVAVYSSG